MEVLVKNIYHQMSEKQVEKDFRPILERFGIKTFHCQKLRSRGCALLTFVDKSKGQYFLHSISGQPKLYIRGRPIHCSLSKNEPDEWLVQALKKEESDRYLALDRKPHIVPGKLDTHESEVDQRSFNLSAIKCGQWTYSGKSLVFSTYWCGETPSRIIFGPRSLLIKLYRGASKIVSHQIVIPFSSTWSFTIGARDRSLTFSLHEPPRIYQQVESSLEDSSSKLGLSLEDALLRLTLDHKAETFKRERICAIDSAHEKIVGPCLCYRFILKNQSDTR